MPRGHKGVIRTDTLCGKSRESVIPTPSAVRRGGHRDESTNGATTQDRPSKVRIAKAMNGRIMVCSRHRVWRAGAQISDIRKGQTFNPVRPGKTPPQPRHNYVPTVPQTGGSFKTGRKTAEITPPNDGGNRLKNRPRRDCGNACTAPRRQFSRAC